MKIFMEMQLRPTDAHKVSHQHGEVMMDALLDLEKVNEDMLDCGTATNLAENTLIVSLTISAGTEPEALEFGLNIVRTALHAIGGGTSKWPNGQDADFHREETRLLPA